jgi:hypothetical protein
MPAHVTVLFPFVSPAQVDDTNLNRLRACFHAHQPFDFVLDRVKQLPGVICLAPEPDDPFRSLTLAVWAAFPECPPYDGKHPDIVPHLTVGCATDEQVLTSITRDLATVAERFLPIPASATEVTLMDSRHGHWAIAATFALGGS